MIGTIKRPIRQEIITNSVCKHCNELNSLQVSTYTTMFVLKIIPFATGKIATLECVNCKKATSNITSLPNDLQEKINDVQARSKNPWFSYIGYILLLGALLFGLLSKNK